MIAQTPMFPSIPVETISAASAVFGKGNAYIVLGDRLESLFAKLDLTQLDHGVRPGYCLLIYALITVFQFDERLSDRRTAEALRTRVDWKYALHLPLVHPGIAPDALCEFRRHLLHTPRALQTFQGVLDAMAAGGLALVNGAPDASSGLAADNVLASICNLSRIEQLTEAVCAAMEALAASQPDWLLKTARPYWFDRYTTRQSWRDLSGTIPEQVLLAQTIGVDARHLLYAITAAPELAQLSEVKTLQQVYASQFDLVENKARWRPPTCVSCTGM